MQEELFEDSVSIEYPCYVIKDLAKIPKHKAVVLNKIISPVKGRRADFKLYCYQEKELYEIGGILKEAVSTIIELLGAECLELRLSKEKIYNGDMLYIMCEGSF